MEREANYAAVGAFVLLVLVMAGSFVYWYSDTREHRDYTRYEVYFDGSVSGLSEGGSVRYLGVDIGRVIRIRIDQRAADRVQVIVDIDSTTPVSERTLAQLSLQGVTGLLYIDLLQEPENSPFSRVLDSVPSERYPVIRSVRSNFDAFVSSLPDLTNRLGAITIRINDVLSDDNIAAISGFLANLDAVGKTLPDTLQNTTALMVDLRATVADSRQVIAQMRQAMDNAGPDLSAAMQKLRTSAENLATATNRLDTLISENRDDLRSFMRDGLPQFEALMRDTRDAAQEFRNFSRSMRDNPSRILYQPPASGVEIPR